MLSMGISQWYFALGTKTHHPANGLNQSHNASNVALELMRPTLLQKHTADQQTNRYRVLSARMVSIYLELTQEFLRHYAASLAIMVLCPDAIRSYTLKTTCTKWQKID